MTLLNNLLVADFLNWHLNYNYPDKGRVYSGPKGELELDTTLKFNSNWDLLVETHQKCHQELLNKINSDLDRRSYWETLNAEHVRSTKGLSFQIIYRVNLTVIKALKTSETMCYVILGGPGGGKGTQSRVLSEKLGLKHISTGDLMRSEIKSGSDLGIKIDSYTKNGGLTPDEVALEVLEKEVAKNRRCKGFVFDGFPRTISQVPLLNALLDKYGFSLNRVFDLEISDDSILIERMKNRAVISGRQDDADETVCQERIRVYRSLTQPLIESYKASGIYHQLDGTQSKEAVTEDLLKKCS